MLNVIAIMGRLVYDPELRTTQQGTSVCRFRIACDRNYAPKGEERQADFIDIVAWRQAAEFVSKYFQRGSLIAIEGSLQTHQYQDKQGNNRTAVEVLANHISFAGSKAAEGPAVRDFDQQTKSYTREAKNAQAALQDEPPHQLGFSSQRERAELQVQAASPDAAPGTDDFAVITDDDGLPF